MPVTVVVGGQFGSEGKGKVAHYLAKTMNAAYAVRCGGSNSGHTVVDDDGRTRVFRHLPTAAILPEVKLAICAGSYIDVEVLLEEIKEAGLTPGRLFIDPKAVIITRECKDAERDSGLVQAIGSTGSGTGAAVAGRVQRKETVEFAKDNEALRPYMDDVADVSARLRECLKEGKRIVIEGTQGFGLSLLHSGFYPKVTSRDTTAAAFVAEAGLSPLDVDDVVLVIRAFPIRVAGNSGPLENETTWEDIRREGGHPEPIGEYTTVTKKPRRVARFDPAIVKKAIDANRPSRIFLNHVDYIRHDMQGDRESLEQYAKKIEREIGLNIDYIGTSNKDVIERQKVFDGRHIPPGMLSSPQIKLYIKNGWLVVIPEGQESVETNSCLKPATYDMRLGNYAVRSELGKKEEFNLGPEDIIPSRISKKLELPPNSLTFVSTHEEFKLPKDVIARFNLKVGLVHKGLLLGTGPIVDPEFSGTINIPIHNFSSQSVTINYLDPLISVEFTKTLHPHEKDYVANENPKGDQKTYIKKAGCAESSVCKAIEESKQLTKKQENFLKVGFVGAIIGIGALVVGIVSVVVTLFGTIKDVNSRIDGLHDVYTSPQIDEISNIQKQHALLKQQDEKIYIKLEELERFKEAIEKSVHPPQNQSGPEQLSRGMGPSAP